MKKILVFGMTENPGGVESVIMNYYREIDKNRLQFDFLCNSAVIAYEQEIEELGGKIYHIVSRKKDFFKFKKQLAEFMKNHAFEYDAIWVNVCSLVNIDYLIAAKKYGISKRIIHCHNSSNDGGKMKFLMHQFNKYRLKKYATHFWSCSDEASPWFFSNSIMNDKDYKVVVNAIDVSKFEQNEKIRKKIREDLGLQDKVVIGHAGRFHFQKNHRFLIEIFKCLVNRNSKYHLVLVGQGELESEIKNLVNRYGLNNCVTFLGKRENMNELYQAMDVFVLPSLFEGLAVVTLEAQAAGVPCVFSDKVSSDAKINDNVVFVELNKNVEVWADTVETIMKIKCKNKMISSKYNIQTQVKNFEKEFIN